ncbi:MAG: hypothetical protein AAB336_00855 [Acidobacteriota bacterium]
MREKRILKILLDNPENEEIFEVNDENIAKVRVFVPDGDKPKELLGEQCHVILEMSKDAMVGFATELLRMAYNDEEDSFKELTPSYSTFVSQYMGIILKSDSCRLSISKQDLGKVKDI